jgi:carboxylesterase type B
MTFTTEHNLGKLQDKSVLIRRPACPQIKDFGWIKSIFPPYASQPREYSFDDLKCTNLNVTFPASALKGDLHGLPVMVYIHGIYLYLMWSKD